MSDGHTEAMRGVKMIKKVFLGGTCAGSQWRDKIIPKLKIDYFDPLVPEWDSLAQKRELKEREWCDYLLYVITPRMKGVYSIAEIIDDSNKHPEKTIFCFLEKDIKEEKNDKTSIKKLYNDSYIYFSEEQTKSLIAVGNMVERNGGKWLKDLNQVIEYLNGNKNV